MSYWATSGNCGTSGPTSWRIAGRGGVGGSGGANRGDAAGDIGTVGVGGFERVLAYGEAAPGEEDAADDLRLIVPLENARRASWTVPGGTWDPEETLEPESSDCTLEPDSSEGAGMDMTSSIPELGT